MSIFQHENLELPLNFLLDIFKFAEIKFEMKRTHQYLSDRLKWHKT